MAPSHTASEKRPPVAGKQPTYSSHGPRSESVVAATAVDNANSSARDAGAAALSNPSSGAIVTQASVLRRRQSNTPHPPLSTSPQPSSSAPLPLLEILSRLQDLLPSEVATREDPVPRHGLGDGRGVVDADEAIVAAASVAATAATVAAGLAGVGEERSPSSTADNDGGGDGSRGVDDEGPRGKVPRNLDGGVFDEGSNGYVRAEGRSYRSLSALSSPGFPPTGLDSWIMPHPLKNCGVFDDDDSGKAEAEPILGCASLRSSALEVAIAAAREVLETGAPAAREAEARAKALRLRLRQR